MTRKKTTRKKTSNKQGSPKEASVLADDPLAWMNTEGDETAETIQKNDESDEKEASPEVEDEITGLNEANIWTGYLDIRDITPAHEHLKLLLQSTGDIRIDLSEVNDLDTAFAQMLISFSNALKMENRKLVLLNINETCQGTLSNLGLLCLKDGTC